MLIAELEKCGKELLINSQSKVITRNFHVFFFLDKKPVCKKPSTSTIEKLLELQRILPFWKGKLSLYKNTNNFIVIIIL